jgi:putative protease
MFAKNKLMSKKPELLLPVGNIEAFHAALQGGADAVYLGLKQFNARGRASNFNHFQLLSMVEIAGKMRVKVYVTLNIVIKNNELPLLIDTLYFLSQANVDGIIIQDWGVYFLAKRYFPKLNIHASTQLGIHNSLGTLFSEKLGFERVVLARELTLKELGKICRKSKVETEVFIHGALCYSFSGMCLFSSYSGGWGANRGVCAQPCRRSYKTGKKQQFLFNLKDNQQIDQLQLLSDFGVSSLKIEGRMKSGEYTYRVAKAYRLALDEPQKLDEAKKMLGLDFGRLKTAYFLGGNVSEAISETTVSGIYLGKVEKIQGNKVFIASEMEIESGFRVRFQAKKNGQGETIKVSEVKKEDKLYVIPVKGIEIGLDTEVYLSGMNDFKFSSRLKDVKSKREKPIHPGFKRKVLTGLSVKKNAKKTEIYFRINSLEWLRNVQLNDMDGLFITLSKTLWKRFNPDLPFLQKNKHKVYIELPKFIAEDSIFFYRDLIKRISKAGFRNFVISHLSQIQLIPEKMKVCTNENVYVFNDASARFLKEQGLAGFMYPQEIDYPTLNSLADKTGIVPVYFYPELFHSRMPVAAEGNEIFFDSNNTAMKRFRRNGITSVVPEQPVSWLHFKNKLAKSGFNRFLIDLSYDTVSKKRVTALKSRLLRSEPIQPSTTFNFSKELK